MILQPMKTSNDKAWMYQVHADFADEEAKAEVFAIRFGSPENATKFKTAFDKAVIDVIENEALVIKEAPEESEKEEASGDAPPKDGADNKDREEKAKDVREDGDVSKDMEKLDLKQQ